jgi:bifunctional non-homologous end joining protein LigD
VPRPSEKARPRRRRDDSQSARRTRTTTRRGTSALDEYEKKRDFSKTPEPAPGRLQDGSGAPTFMVHKHDATRLHYDVRLEMDGALASWAVPKGPSFDPEVKRLAVETEDHPLEYGGFEGRIPDDEYGGGDSLIWDRGTYESVPPGHASSQRKKGHLEVVFHGEKLKGRWHLVRTRGDEKKPHWLLFKAKDDLAYSSLDIVKARPESVVSGRIVTRGPETKKALAGAHVAPDRLLEKVFPPMLATLVDEAPAAESEWVLELKYDGYRALAAVSKGRVEMRTRNNLDLRSRFPTVAAALEKIHVGEAVIDGEIVGLDKNETPRFQLLHETKHPILVAFDILWLDGEDLRERPLEERRDLLLSVLSRPIEGLRIAERVAGPATDALATSLDRGFEGLMVKRRGSTYEAGRSKSWLKLKGALGQELAIVGFTRNKSHPKQLGALQLAFAEGKHLVYAGKVGTGFSTKLRTSLKSELADDAVDTTEVREAPRSRDTTWVEPRLVAEVRFTEWTSDHRLRHPSFVGLRPDKTPLECTRERPAPPEKTSSKKSTARLDSDPKVRLTHPEKVFYPRDGITKAEVAVYYEEVSSPLLRALAGRPLSLEHYRNGIDQPPLFQQNIGKLKTPWMHVVETPLRTRKGDVSHLVADGPDVLRWFAQHGALTVHAWASREGSLESPDWMVFDLDPADGKTIDQTIPIALALRRALEDIGLGSVPKTSGKRGLHLYIPLSPGHSFEEVQDFAVQFGQGVATLLPEVTLERSLAKRKGRLYLDCLQNAYGKTMVAPYSLRAIDGAPVSAPLRWTEVKKGLDPARFNLKTMKSRLDKVGDLFEAALAGTYRLPKLAS